MVSERLKALVAAFFNYSVNDFLKLVGELKHQTQHQEAAPIVVNDVVRKLLYYLVKVQLYFDLSETKQPYEIEI